MTVYTSYFAKVDKLALRYPDMVFMSIAGYAPDWLHTNIFKYKKLAPKKDWWQEWHNTFENSLESKESKDWYVSKYNETVLSKLTQSDVIAELKEISAGNDICLLCWEEPTKFCHRHIVAEWLKNGGVNCDEIK